MNFRERWKKRPKMKRRAPKKMWGEDGNGARLI
jgi:hypothetical protein